MHKLKYLPLAQKDLRDITSFIAEIHKAPEAALNLVDALENYIYRLQQFPYSCKVYQLTQPLEAEYRMLNVKNYCVFYVVREHEIEIHRIIYAKMDMKNLII